MNNAEKKEPTTVLIRVSANVIGETAEESEAKCRELADNIRKAMEDAGVEINSVHVSPATDMQEPLEIIEDDPEGDSIELGSDDVSMRSDDTTVA